MRKTFGRIALLITFLPAGAAAQDAKTVIANASRAMGADNLKSLTYSGIGGGRQLRAEQDHCRAVGGHDDHELHARDRSHRPRFARHRHDDAAGDSRGAAAPTGNPQSERHAGEHRVAAAARDLGHPVGFPDGRRGQQRDGPLAADRWQGVQRRVVVAGSEGTVGRGVPAQRLHQRSEPGRARRNLGGARRGRRSPRRHGIQQLSGLWRAEGARTDRAEASRPADVRRHDHERGREPGQHRAAAAAAAGRRAAVAPERRQAARLRRRRCNQRSSPTASTGSPAAMWRSPSTCRITSSCSKAGRAKRAAWR